MFQPLVGETSDPFDMLFSAAQVREQSASQAVILAGDGAFTNVPSSSQLIGPGAVSGIVTMDFGDRDVDKTVEFAPTTNSGTLEQVLYPDGPGGADPPVPNGELDELIVIERSRTSNPAGPNEQALLDVGGYHMAAVVRIEDNPLTSAAGAPTTIDVDLVSYDSDGLEVDRISNLTLTKIADEDDGDPAHFVYANDLTVPIVPVDTVLSAAAYPISYQFTCRRVAQQSLQ